jgi:fluoride exporter
MTPILPTFEFPVSVVPHKLPEHALQRKGFRRVATSRSPKDYRELAAVFAGGALGTLARTGLSSLVVADPTRWPWPTFTVNIVGAFLVGYFTTRLLERLPLSSYRRPLLGTGLCGGLTTFSTMQLETLKMIEHHCYGLAAGYTFASIMLGLLAVYLATAVVRRVPVR